MPHQSVAQHVSNFLVAWRWPLLAAGLLATALAYRPAHHLQFDRSIEKMFAPGDPLLAPYEQLKRTFGGNEVVMAAYVDPKLMSARGIARLQSLTDRLSHVAGVDAVVSLSNTRLKEDIVNDSVFSRAYIEVFTGYAIGADRQTTGVVCMLVSESNAPCPRAETIARIREIVEKHDASGVVIGEPVMVVEGFRALEEDGELLGWVSTIFLMATIVYCFRSVRWVLVPIVVVNVTLLWTKASLVVWDLKLSMVSSMLWAVVTVVGVAAVMHLVVAIREARDTGVPPREALRLAGGEMLVPLLWVLATDAAGFGSLMAAEVGPVQDFGFMMALGSVLAVISVAVMLPGLALLGRIDSDPKRAWGESKLDAALSRLVRAILRHPWLTGFVTIAATAAAGIGALWLDVETDFTKNFRASSPVVRSYALVESRLGGAGVWDIFLPAPAKLDTAYIDHVHRLQQRLRDEVRVVEADGTTQPGLTKVLSLVDALDALNRDWLTALVARQFSVQSRVRRLEREMPAIVRAVQGEDPLSPGQHYFRIMLRSRERQSAAQKKRLIADVERISREEFPQAQVTGFFVLLTNLIDSLVSDQWRTFCIASGTIALMMLVAYRSLALAAVAMAPNLLPMFLVSGIMGWLGMKINMGAAMIAAVTVGLSVDSSIHYIHDFRHFRRRGMSRDDALHEAHQNAGRAMTFTTMALVIGFSALCWSQFVPLIYFGALMCLSMIGGLIGNLVLLPLLLAVVHRK